MEQNTVQIVWGTPILDDGFANVPNMLIRNYRKLGITHGEFGLIMQLISYKHDEGNPFPSQETLADNLGSSTRAIRKLISGLENKNLIWVEYQYIDGKRTSNVYILKPLIDKCLELFGEKHLPNKKPKRRSYRKTKKNNSVLEPQVPVVEEPQVPVVEEPQVPVGSEPQVPTNITSEYNNINMTSEYNNLSIKEGDIQKLDLPISVQQTLIKNIDRLIDDNINIHEISSTFNAFKNRINTEEFNYVLENILTKTKTKIQDIKNILSKGISNHLKSFEANQDTSHIHRETTPDWMESNDNLNDTSESNPRVLDKFIKNQAEQAY